MPAIDENYFSENSIKFNKLKNALLNKKTRKVSNIVTFENCLVERQTHYCNSSKKSSTKHSKKPTLSKFSVILDSINGNDTDESINLGSSIITNDKSDEKSNSEYKSSLDKSLEKLDKVENMNVEHCLQNLSKDSIHQIAKKKTTKNIAHKINL